MNLQVGVVDGDVTAPLRRVVLRPHQSIEEMAGSVGDEGATHVAATDDGRVVGAGLVREEAPPWDPGARGTWRIRGMATDPGRRGEGVGTIVLAALVERAAAGGARQVWCSARVPALGLYERAGFVAVGDRWEDPVLGPHVHLRRSL